MTDTIADLFNVAMVLAAIGAAILYVQVIRENHTKGVVRILDVMSIVLALYTATFYTWALFGTEPDSLQSWVDQGRFYVRPLILLFMILLCCRAYVRRYLKGGSK